MPKPTPLSGFPELLPAGRMVEQRVLDTLREVFELHGFAGVETRAVEPLDQLLRQGETSKEVYVLRRLHEESAEGHAGLGLHFDLTVPFARYVLENAGHLEFPFRRYQIQRVWRGERPQVGRYREFTQADIDVIGRDTLAPHHDVEVARAMVDALTQLDFMPRLRLQVNNRKVVQGYYAGLGIEAVVEAMRVIDKLDKLPRDEVAGLLVERAGLSAEQADGALRLTEISGSDGGVAEAVRGLGVEDPLLEEGLAELTAVLEGTADLAGERVEVRADLAVSRGLDYYTGTVFETRVIEREALGSICSGGRYDALATDGRTTYPGVGISFGVSRVLVSLLGDGALRASRSVPSAVVVAVVDDDGRPASDAVAARLRARGISCEVSASAQKFGKQIRYAERRGVPFVWFCQVDGRHEVKDIRTGEQVEADPDRWSPPLEDLRPQVVMEEQQ